MVITVKRGHSQKMHIYLDGSYVVTTTIEKWLTCGFQDGDYITDEQWAELHTDIYFDKLYLAALGILSHRDHTRHEMYDKLYQKFIVKPHTPKAVLDDGVLDKAVSSVDKTFVVEHINSVCDKLELQGFLDDERFARLYVQELIRTKHLGKSGIRQALQKRGVSRDIIDLVCEETEFYPLESIKIILSSRYRNADLYDESQIAKVITYLQRKGYTYSEIREAIYEYLNTQYYLHGIDDYEE